jgi:hypothetical protein
MRITPDHQPPTINVQQTISILSALVDNLKIEDVVSIFMDFYQLHPQQAVTVLLTLLSGDNETRIVFSSLLKGLFAADRVIAGRVFLGLIGLGSGEA